MTSYLDGAAEQPVLTIDLLRDVAYAQASTEPSAVEEACASIERAFSSDTTLVASFTASHTSVSKEI